MHQETNKKEASGGGNYGIKGVGLKKVGVGGGRRGREGKAGKAGKAGKTGRRGKAGDAGRGGGRAGNQNRVRAINHNPDILALQSRVYHILCDWV